MIGRYFKWGDDRREAGHAAPELYRDGVAKNGAVVHLRRIEYADLWVSEVCLRHGGKKYGLKTEPYPPGDVVRTEETLERACVNTLRVLDLGPYPVGEAAQDEYRRAGKAWRDRMRLS